MSERLEIDADKLRFLFEVLIQVDRADKLPANGLKVLAFLALQPDGSAYQAAVAATLSLSHDQMGRGADKLHALGLLRRREVDSDRRAQMLSLTAKGWNEVGQFVQAMQSLVDKFAKSRKSA